MIKKLGLRQFVLLIVFNPFTFGCGNRGKSKAEAIRLYNLFFLLKQSTARPPETGRIFYHRPKLKEMKLAKEYALRQEKAFLLTFAAGQKYGVWRHASRRFCLCVYDQTEEINRRGLPASKFIFFVSTKKTNQKKATPMPCLIMGTQIEPHCVPTIKDPKAKR